MATKSPGSPGMPIKLIDALVVFSGGFEDEDIGCSLRFSKLFTGYVVQRFRNFHIYVGL
jgi:hypothetical protein